MTQPRAMPCKSSGCRGQGTVEFALTASVFLLLTFTVIQMGLVIYTYNTLASATRDAVRYATMHGPNRTPTALQSDVKTVLLNNAAGLNATNLTVNLTWPADANMPSQSDAKLNVSYNYQVQIPFASTATLTLTATSQMLVEQ
jgi:Flp pilus assembly protein TadG